MAYTNVGRRTVRTPQLGDAVDDYIAAGTAPGSALTAAPNSVEAAKNAYYVWLGTPYDGAGTSVDSINADIHTAVKVANKDVATAINVLLNPHSYGDSLRSLALQSINNYIAGVPYDQIASIYFNPPGGATQAQWSNLWRAATGSEPTAQPWYKDHVQLDWLAAGYIPGVGGLIRIQGDTIQVRDYKNPNGWTSYGNWADPSNHPSDFRPIALENFQYGLDHGYVTVPAGFQMPGITVPVLPDQQAAIDAATAASGAAPSGWRQATSASGVPGWVGPDGLFYTGSAPWTNPVGGSSFTATVNQPDQHGSGTPVVDDYIIGDAGGPANPANQTPGGTNTGGGIIIDYAPPTGGGLTVNGAPLPSWAPLAIGAGVLYLLFRRRSA